MKWVYLLTDMTGFTRYLVDICLITLAALRALEKRLRGAARFARASRALIGQTTYGKSGYGRDTVEL